MYGELNWWSQDINLTSLGQNLCSYVYVATFGFRDSFECGRIAYVLSVLEFLALDVGGDKDEAIHKYHCKHVWNGYLKKRGSYTDAIDSFKRLTVSFKNPVLFW